MTQPLPSYSVDISRAHTLGHRLRQGRRRTASWSPHGRKLCRKSPQYLCFELISTHIPTLKRIPPTVISRTYSTNTLLRAPTPSYAKLLGRPSAADYGGTLVLLGQTCRDTECLDSDSSRTILGVALSSIATPVGSHGQNSIGIPRLSPQLLGFRRPA